MRTFSQGAAFRLRGAYLLMRRRYNAHFAPPGVTADQYVVLSLLKKSGEGTQRELADLSYADVNTIAAMLRLLEEKKLIRRTPHKTDGRATTVALTSGGEETLKACNTSSAALQAAVERCFPREARSEVIATLDRLAERMANAGDL